MNEAPRVSPRSRQVLLLGRDRAADPPRPLQAGPVRVELDEVGLRVASRNGSELFQVLYVAVRDRAWNNLPGTVTEMAIEEGDGPTFDVRFTSVHAGGGQRFSWQGRITGDADGSIAMRMTGTTDTGLDYLRLGFCVLHGARSFAGRPYRRWLGAAESAGVLPATIGIQGFADGMLQGLFEPFDRLEIDASDGSTVRFEFGGDDFEMEDQRNFGDASFKTYSTPIARGGPYRLAPGETLEQSVRVSVLPSPSGVAPVRTSEPVVVHVGGSADARLPDVGLGAASDGVPLTDAELDRVATLRPHHIRVEALASDPVATRGAALTAAAAEARALGAELHVDLSVAAEDAEAVPALMAEFGELDPAPDAVFLVSTENEPPDRGESLRLLRAARVAGSSVSPTMIIGVGDDFAFTNLHRWPFDGEVVGMLSYPLSPTVHLADDRSLVENLDRLEDMAPAIRDRLGTRTLAVGPITLATRHGPYPDGVGGPDDLPDAVDARQMSLLGAAWAVGCLAGLAYSGVDVLTFFETTGWRGVTERDAGPPMPERFHSRPGETFPLWHVLADMAEWRGGGLVQRRISPSPISVGDLAALAVSDDAGAHILVASLVPRPRTIELRLDADAAPEANLRILDAASAEMAMADPAGFRARTTSSPIADGRLQLDLDAYAVARIDVGRGI